MVCQQWNSLIAVSYAARKFGISRMATAEDAKKACPDIVLAHVATFKKGETEWKYHDNPNPVEHKVSLDPFRKESRKIFRVVKKHVQEVEKAGIDEMFADLGPSVRKMALEYFPELASIEDAAENLPGIPETLPDDAKWTGIIFGTESDKAPEPPKDWDDVLLMMASVVIARIRQDVFDTLGYTCSAGLSRNKILAKLGSAKNKPNNQTIVRSDSVAAFLETVEVRDVWGYGGKLGEQLVSALDLPESGSFKMLREVPMDTLKRKLDPSLAVSVYNLARGNQASEISNRVNIKSMQSVKQFGSTPLENLPECHEWIRVYAADLAGRLIDLDEDLESTQRPKTVVLHCGQFKPRKISHSKQGQFPAVRQAANFQTLLDALYDSGCQLLAQVNSESSEPIFPMTSLSLGVSGIETVTSKSAGSLDFFLVRRSATKHVAEAPSSPPEDSLFVSDDESIKCERCKKSIPIEAHGEHMDWHFAKDLQEEEERSTQPSQPPQPATPPKTRTKSTPGNASKKPKVVKGNQTLLNFFQPREK